MRAASPTPQYHIPRPQSIAGSEPASSQPVTPVSPTFQDIPIPREISRSIVPVAEESTNEQKDLARSNLAELENHYSIWWECADLLIELGGAAPPATAGVSAATKTPTMTAPPKPRFGVLDSQATPRPKDRHATLPTQAPPSIPSLPSAPTASASHAIDISESNTSISRRRGSTGQQDLNARQVQLLKSMLNTPNPGDLSAALDPPQPYSSLYQGLSPVISHPSSTVRTVSGSSDLEKLKQQPTDQNLETSANKGKKRQRHISLAGKLGVKEILAGLRWAKEKAKQWPKGSVPPTPAKEEFPLPIDSRTSIDLASTRESIDQSTPAVNEIIAPEPIHDESMISSPIQTQAAPPSPYKRSRRRSLASIFKFGNATGAPSGPKSASRSRSRVDLTSPTAISHDHSSRYDGSRTDDQGTTDADSDWDHMNSPSDFPGRFGSHRNASVSNHDLSSTGSVGRGRIAPVGVPINGKKSRRGSTVSRNQSLSRPLYSSASPSNASLTSSSVFGSMPSHQSLHEVLGVDRTTDTEDDRRRLKKAMKSSRRPPSAGGRKSRPSPSQTSPPRPLPYSSSPPVTSPIADRPYYSTHFTSHQSQISLASSTRIPAAASTRSLHAPSQSPSAADLAQPRLALTPENIVPLLVYAREVKSQLADCIAELKVLESDLLLSKVVRGDNSA
jgi:serine/arginine repetitive matrix protein 2